METIGDRIKRKRKELGFTQAELGAKLNVTDRAVSKWEQNEGNPDISIIAPLADALNISLDYLITGKIIETISIDDMDSEKRALYFIKKDDVENFEKYGYVQSEILVAIRQSNDMLEERFLKAIYENESKLIFKRCLCEALKSFDVNRIIGTERVKFIRGSLDDYIRMCCKTDYVEGLQFIDLKYFAVGDKTDISNVIKLRINDSYSPSFSEDNTTFTISRSILDEVFSKIETSEQIINYLSNVEFFKSGDKKIYLMTDDIVYQLYKNKMYEKLNKIIRELEEYNSFAEKVYNERLSSYREKRISKNAIYYVDSLWVLKAYVTPIRQALELSKSEKDFEWLKIFNNYNKDLSVKVPELRLSYYKDEEIKLMELENDKNTPIEDIISIKYKKGDFLCIKRLLSDETGLGEDKAEILRNKISQIKKLKKFIQSNYICVNEFVYDCLEKGLYKPLFKFATDLKFADLQNAVIEGNNDLIVKILNDLFIPSEKTINHLSTPDRFSNTHVICGGVEDVVKTQQARISEYNKYIVQETQRVIDDKINSHRNKVDCDYYKTLLKLQFENIPLDQIYASFTMEAIQNKKQQLIDYYLTMYADELEEVTHEKALEREYNQITSELSKEYLLSELEKGEADKVVVLICKRLQIILEYKFRYSGDLFTMIDTLIKNKMQLHNCYDDEDNDYYRYQEEDRISTKRTQLLHKLRMKRNNIVHPETVKIDMSIEEIKECLELIEFLSK